VISTLCLLLGERGGSFRNRGNLAIIVGGDKRRFNQYGVMLVNPAKDPTVKQSLGQQFIDWLISPEGQSAIANTRSMANSYSILTQAIRAPD
jgi:tungstate transport system substrate-binding protein